MIRWLVQSAESVPPSNGWLDSAESAHCLTLKSHKRQFDWLLGRWTAKNLARHVLASRGAPVALDAIVVGNRPSGEPFVAAPAALADSTLSISHARGHALCALVADAVLPLGADIEAVEPRHPDFAADYFTAAEQALVAQTPSALRPTIVTAVWSAKEAALKALHKGLSVDTRSVTCLIAPPADAAPTSWEPFTIIVDGDRLPDAPALTGYWRAFGAFVLTLAVGATPNATTGAVAVGQPAEG